MKIPVFVSAPTSLNAAQEGSRQLEAGILFGLGLPVPIFREDGITGGVFDNGVTDVFIHKMPPAKPNAADLTSLKEVFLKWHSRVSHRYYGA